MCQTCKPGNESIRIHPAGTKMKFEDRLSEKIGRKTGFVVPEGYFDSLADEVSAKLPEMKAPEAVPLSRWQRVRPYIYLAAMFAGIWCMMKMFHLMSQPANLDLENPPALVAQAIGDCQADPLNLDSYTFTSGESEFEIEQEVVDSYNGIEELAEDFGYDFDPAYSEIEITTTE